MTYRGQRGFPSSVGAEPANPGILIRREGGIQAGGAHGFDQTPLCVGSL